MTAPTSPTPDRIVEIAIGYMGAKQLFAATRTGLFRALAGGARSASEIAASTGSNERTTRILADAMSALGLLTRTDGRYALTPDAAEYLAGSGSLDLAPYLNFLDKISYGHWLQFDHTVDTGKPGELGLDEAGWGTFMGGVMRYNALHAAMLARTYDFSGHRSMLDLGGLSPAFAIQALHDNPDLSARFVFAPEMSGTLAADQAAVGLAERAAVEPAPTETAAPGGDHDIVMVNHVIHRFSAEQNRAILVNARGAARAGATLLLLDFFLDDDEHQRALDALHAGEYLVIDGTIVYPVTEVREWLAAAGWRPREVLSLPGSPRVIVAEAV